MPDYTPLDTMALLMATSDDLANLRRAARDAVTRLDGDHFPTPSVTPLCATCGDPWPCIANGVARDLDALLPPPPG